MYIYLYNGRKTIKEEMDDWGEEGPTFGPLTYAHTTYANEIKLQFDDGRDGILYIKDGLVYYKGMWYGDWSCHIYKDSKAIVSFNQEHANGER